MKKRQGSINLSDIERKRNNDGLVICLNCDKSLPKRRQKYCSDECSYEWATKHSHQLMRSKLIKKCKGKCKICNKIPIKKENRYIGLTDEEWQEIRLYAPIIELNSEYAILLDDTQLILDHRIPIALGGAEFDEANLQILCCDCNKIKTRKDHVEIAKARRLEKIMSKGQTLLITNKKEDYGLPQGIALL